ncbi:MAG: type VI secretion system tube protein Hcp [Acidobacteria bacterium]|nr:type VI secretion system tube protein Hcp [Acidobacteriota bacterium]
MAAFDAFLKIDGVDGETEDKEFTKNIELMSYSFGATQSGSFQYGGGGATGKVQFQDFHFTKRCDNATPFLFEATCTGKHIAKAVLSVRKATGDGGQKVFYKVTFEDILVSSQTLSGTGSGDPVPTESISLNFSKLIQAYGKQDAKGAISALVPKGWDQKKNVKV